MVPTADASGARPIPISALPDEFLLAFARVEQSLKLVLAHIAIIQREMGINNTPDVPLKPDDSWIGTP